MRVSSKVLCAFVVLCLPAIFKISKAFMLIEEKVLVAGALRTLPNCLYRKPNHREESEKSFQT